MKHSNLVIAGALLLSASAFVSTANASKLPECDQSGVLSRVSKHLTTAEANVVRSGDPVTRIEKVQQSKMVDVGPRLTAQRFCSATGYTEQGKKQSIYYLIEAKAGFAGYGYAVEACMPSRDPWRIHGAYCRSVR